MSKILGVESTAHTGFQLFCSNIEIYELAKNLGKRDAIGIICEVV